MTTPEHGKKIISLDEFHRIAGKDVVNVVCSKVPSKVLSRISKSAYHFEMAKRLAGYDDEMAAIRLIAVEEELVVAFFELIKTQLQAGGRYKTFVKKYKSHQVKLSFYPVLSQIKFILKDIVLESLDNSLHENIDWSNFLVIENDKAFFRIYLGGQGNYIDHNPMALVVSLEDESYESVLESMFNNFKKLVESQTGLSVRQFIESRSDFRNQLLYASDAGVASLGVDIDFLINEVFTQVVHDLMWVLCIVVSHPVDNNSDYLLRQFFDLYRMILREAKIKDI